ncbi:MAG: UbiA family prenyltransferase [Bacteroidota bacterium]
MNNTVENSAPFLKRFWQYQSERFPFAKNGFLIAVFTFSAASYSRIYRGAEGFIPFKNFLIGAITAILLFFLLRLADEFKDAEDDAKYRPYRPVPRGLISLKELAITGICVILFQIILNALFLPKLLSAYFLALAYLALMTKEFFVHNWLKRRPIIYMASHMVILPMIDFYTSGLDWIQNGVSAPRGLIFFLISTFLNGIVIEIGRKIRAPEAEEHGVETYSALYGSRRATWTWIAVTSVTFLSAVVAAWFAGFGMPGFFGLLIFLIIALIPALKFLKTANQTDAAKIETAAGIWTIGMYLTLGAVPFIIKILQQIL